VADGLTATVTATTPATGILRSPEQPITLRAFDVIWVSLHLKRTISCNDLANASAARAQGALDIAELTALSWRILCIGIRRRGRADLPRSEVRLRLPGLVSDR
jgi:hypothetical protein